MLTYALLAMAVWGTDPGIVFSGDPTPWHSTISRTDRPPTAADRSASDETSILRPDIVRGQSVSDHDPARFEETGFDRFLEHPAVKEFVSAMNPFVDEPVKTLPNYYDPFGFQMGTGTFGSPGYRLGWSTYNEFALLPSAAARGTTGSMQIVEWNSYLKYSHIVSPGVIFNGTGYFNARWWEGPTGTPVPGQVDQVSTDLELGFFNDGPWSGQIAFHPQIVETYEARLDRNAFNFDGRAIVTYKDSPQWSFVGGIAVWDRVNTLIVPHVGVIWTPDDRWEFRMLFPKSRISYLLGNLRGADFWLYGQAEYTAESWQSFDKETFVSDRIQITDDRLSLGLRWDKGRYSFFTEGGFVFNRRVIFQGSAPSFDLDNTGMIRGGVRY